VVTEALEDKERDMEVHWTEQLSEIWERGKEVKIV